MGIIGACFNAGNKSKFVKGYSEKTCNALWGGGYDKNNEWFFSITFNKNKYTNKHDVSRTNT